MVSSFGMALCQAVGFQTVAQCHCQQSSLVAFRHPEFALAFSLFELNRHNKEWTVIAKHLTVR